jgi:hypothetical protein
MAPIEITESEILAAIAAEARGNGPKEAKTGPEIRDALSIGEKRFRRAFRQLKREGRLVVHQVMRESIDGRPVMVPAYTITPAKRK